MIRRVCMGMLRRFPKYFPTNDCKSMENGKIGIVTVLYNSEPVLEDFFRTLNEQTYTDFVLYLVDNASKDESVFKSQEYAKFVSFECKWLLQKENLGVAEGNNIGIRAALEDKCDYVLLSNNDIVLQLDTIEKLLEGMLSMKATMAVPKIYYWDDPKKIWMAGGSFRWLQCSVSHRGENEIDAGQYDFMEFMSYAPTCFMLIKSSKFKDVGLMDENYFVYYDDTDFVFRASRIYSNKVILYVYNSIIWHKVSSCTGGGESDFTLKYVNRNQVYFALKNASKIRLFCFLCYLVIHFFCKKIHRYNARQRRLILKSYVEGFNLYCQVKHLYLRNGKCN